MSDATRLLEAAAAGDRQAAAAILPIVYDQLRALAARELLHERPGQTLQATALVHEAYLRLVGVDDRPRWKHSRHFYGAAAQAMRRILVENARRRRTLKRGGAEPGHRLPEVPDLAAPDDPTDWIAVDEALDRLDADDPQAAELARLRIYAGLSVDEAARVLDISRATAYRDWTYARARLGARLREPADDPPPENPVVR